MVAMASERFLTVAEVAEQLRVSEFTIRNWLRSGRLQGYRPGGRKAGWRIRQTDIEQFISESKERPNE